MSRNEGNPKGIQIAPFIREFASAALSLVYAFGYFISLLRVLVVPLRRLASYKERNIPGKKEPCDSMELEILRTQLKSQIQQHQVRCFLLRLLLTNYLQSVMHAD